MSIVLWIVSALVALAFLASGMMKLTQQKQKWQPTAVFISVDALRALTSMKTAGCCDSRWSPMPDASCSQDSTYRAVRASRQTLCKVL
jgi:hypothetical protein